MTPDPPNHEPTPGTIPELFTAAVARRGEASALGTITGGRLQWLSWRELADQVAAWQTVFAGEFGMRRGDRVAQLSANCGEWIVADLAIQGLGAVHVPLHAALAPEQAAAQIRHSGASVVVVREAAMAERLRPLVDGVQFATHGEMVGRASAAVRGPAIPSPALCGDDLATILYTSGTTGEPLGVMLSQRNLVTNAHGIAAAVKTSGDETRLGILPLSHIYARTCDFYSWLVHGAKLVIAESRETVFRDLLEVRPTAINAVPYFYQKVVDRLRVAGVESSSPQRARTGGGADADPSHPLDGAALRGILGGAVKRCFCGGAGLPPETDRFFAERGLPILCGYGLTEAAPVISATSPGGYRTGTVGPPLPGVEVRLADDGEIECRGPNVMQGYWQNAEATARVLQDGWLRTGDLGEWDAAGHLRIAGRKKELIVLATGKNVAPAQLEQRLNGSPWIEQACVVGDGRKCLAALIVPQGDALRREIKRRRLLVWSRRRALSHPKILALYREEINRCLSDLAEFEQIAAFTLVGRAFSLDLGEVTPKLSLRRAVINERFAIEIDAMYRRSLTKHFRPPPPGGEGLGEGG